MSFHLYRRPDGSLEVTDYQLPVELFPGYEYFSSFEQRPDIAGNTINEAGELVPDLDQRKASAKSLVERVRDRRINAPVIVYDGKNLDADAESIQRVEKKLAALAAHEARGGSMPLEKLVWRDADNVTHSFASHQEYKLWLAGFAVALDDRGTAAFAWSWEKKALIDQAETCDELDAISLES